MAVNIIIAAKNAASTLPATIESVAAQSYGDWTAVIVNDGSSDRTPRIAQAWSDRDSRIHTIATRSTTGVAAARNAGVQNGTADWLLFLDADDLITADTLDHLVNTALSRDDCDVAYSSGARLTPTGRLGAPEVPPPSDHFLHLCGYNPFYTHACLVRRKTFERFRGFDTALSTCEDWDLWQRLARAGCAFVEIERCLAFYRMRPDSLSHDSDRLFRDASIVIKRGFATDDRVDDPDSRYSNGLPGSSTNRVIAIAAWCVANAIGAGRDPKSFLERMVLPSADKIDLSAIVSMVLGGVPNGACALQEDWPILWPNLNGRIVETFELLSDACRAPSFATEAVRQLLARMPKRAEIATAGLSRLGITAPGIGKVDFGDLERATPIAVDWGYGRGQPIDRLYIERFLDRHRSDIQGRVLEAGDNMYTRAYGGQQVTCSDVLNIDQGIAGTTILADLNSAEQIGSDLFDCIILTQTLQYVFDLPAAITTLHRLLKPGGVLLLSVPGCTPRGYDRWSDHRYWSFTDATVSRLLKQSFPSEMIETESRGNVMAVTAFLHGLSQRDLPGLCHQLDDPQFPLVVMARAVKPCSAKQAQPVATILPCYERAQEFARQVAAPSASSVMVVAAHPDDEVIGAGGHLMSWPEVMIVHVTHGSPKDPSFAAQAGITDPLEYAVARRHEAEEALALANIQPDRIRCLGFGDQECSFKIAQIATALLSLIDRIKPAAIVTHAYEGGHPDHDAVCAAVQAAVLLIKSSGALSPAVVEMTSYFGRDGIRVTSSFLNDTPPSATFELTGDRLETKKKMFACYRSQRELLSLFPIRLESFRPAPRYDFHIAPHQGRLFYEHHNLGIDGNRWRAEAVSALRELRLE